MNEDIQYYDIAIGDTGKLWRLQFPEFIAQLVKQHGHYYDVTYNNGHQAPWHSPMWTFTRLVKGWYKEEIKAKKAWRDVDAQVKKLGGWDHCIFISRGDAEAEFITNWTKIKNRPDETVIDVAIKRAELFQVYADEDDSPEYKRFTSVACWLQFTAGDRNITLPVRDLAERLKVDKNTVSRWRQRLVMDDVIEQVKPHVFVPGGNANRATEFRVKPHVMDNLKRIYADKVK